MRIKEAFVLLDRIQAVLPDVRPYEGYAEGAEADYASAALSEIDSALDQIKALLTEGLI